MNRSRRCAAPILAALMLAAPTAVRAELIINEEEYRDWVGRCETESTTGEITCFIYTGRVVEVEGTELSARVVVGLGDGMSPIVYLDVPDIAEPAEGFQLQIDQRPPYSGLFTDCSIGWCRAATGGQVAEQLIRDFRVGAQATVSFRLESERVQIDMPLSLMGFTAAFTRLSEIHRAAAEATAEEAAEAAAAIESGSEGTSGEEEPSSDGTADGDDAAGTDDGAEAAADDDGQAPAAAEEPSEAGDAPEGPTEE